jgi:hypothetical protein
MFLNIYYEKCGLFFYRLRFLPVISFRVVDIVRVLEFSKNGLRWKF